jgi:hypothetical protein
VPTQRRVLEMGLTARKLRFQGHPPTSKIPSRPSGARSDLSGRCEALGLGPPRAAEGHRRRAAKGTATELIAHSERRMSTRRRSAYAHVHVPMPEHRVHRPGAGRWCHTGRKAPHVSSGFVRFLRAKTPVDPATAELAVCIWPLTTFQKCHLTTARSRLGS